MNWKGHTILGLIFSLPVIFSPEHIFLALAGALYPDLDHEYKEEIVKRGLLISGSIVLINILLYFFNTKLFNLEFFILAVLIFFIFIIPYFSEHRTYTHTFYSLIMVSLIMGYFVYKLSILSPTFISLLMLAMVTSENLLGKVIIYALIGWLILTIVGFKYSTEFIFYFLPIFAGYLSHLVGDSLTPKGIKPLYPLNYKLKKEHAIIITIIWFIFALYLRFFIIK
ncbi:metal-dependent hydrolase [Methanocaldococcus indicus]|uniref:metal-dependent hydrolase n=1 Tax=Methanocaldococcus indicus TaxID=213231 RepID=UPI003C6DB6AA